MHGNRSIGWTLLVIPEMQIKLQWDISLYSQENIKHWWGRGEIRTLICCQCKCKIVQSFWKTVWQFLKILNIELPYESEISPLDIYLTEMKTYIHTKKIIHKYSKQHYWTQLNKKAETTPIYFGWWMDKESVIYSCSGTLFGNKEEWSTNACRYC